jgi:hypothetical protein
MRLLDYPEDWYWYEYDQASYDKEYSRQEEEYQKQWNEHMSKFTKPYKLTKTELEERIENQKKRCDAVKRMGAPVKILEHEKSRLDELTTLYGNKDWLYYSQDKIYRLEYEKARAEFEFNFEPVIPAEVIEHIETKNKGKAKENAND